MATPIQTNVQRPSGSRLLGIVAVLIVFTAFLVVLMN
jgi:hypothetical protein